LKERYTNPLVSHSIQQASRVADRVTFLLNGELIEEGPAAQIFTRPKERRTEDSISGKFG
jgi:phosphate transport system ATP-binding protein